MNIVSGGAGVMPFIVGVGGVANGDLVVLSAGTVIKATDPIGASTCVGIALDDAVATATVLVDVIGEGAIVQAPYTGATKTSLASTDIGTVFDIASSTTVDLDDTTGGSCLCIGYDNLVDEIMFVVPKAQRYL